MRESGIGPSAPVLIDRLSPEGAKALVQNPLINVFGLASQFCNDDRKRPDQALRKRILLSERISDATLERLTAVLNSVLTEVQH